jgi:CubicO group peptidase (beta-lactamase class C family)
MDSEMLAKMFQHISDQKINLHSLLIIRNGYLVTEAYYQPYTQDQLQYLASVTKSVIGALIGIVIQEGLIQDVDQTLVSFFPDKAIANLDEQKQAITLKHLLSLTAGLKCNDAPFSGEPGMEQSPDWVQFMLDMPMSEQPGTKFNYCSGAVHLLSAILQKTTGMRAREYANLKLFEPLGISPVPETRWSSDPQGISTGPWGLYLTPRDMARLGYLYLQNGKWNDQQILPADYVKAVSTSYSTKDNGMGYGYLWTVDPDQGSFSALGLAGQHIYVIPSKNLVIVFTGTLPSYQFDMDFLPLKALVDNYILPAVKSDQALPANPVEAEKLTDWIGLAADPEPLTSTIPEGAMQYSGIVYQLENNTNQWVTISFDIQPESDTVIVTVNDQPVDPPIGLDGVFRIQSGAEIFAPQAMRGTWVDDHTFDIQLVYLGELGDIDCQADLAVDEVNLICKSVVMGQEMVMHGAPAPK